MDELTLDKPARPKAKPTNIFATVEMHGDSRLILALEDGRKFGVDLPQPLSKDEPLPAKAELAFTKTDETGVPQDAAFSKFIV